MLSYAICRLPSDVECAPPTLARVASHVVMFKGGEAGGEGR